MAEKNVSEMSDSDLCNDCGRSTKDHGTRLYIVTGESGERANQTLCLKCASEYLASQMSAAREQHTQSPWVIRFEGREHEPGFCIASRIDEHIVCESWFPGRGPKDYARVKADARLITAAPDLLEACKGAAAYIEQQMRMDFDYMPEMGIANVVADSPTLNQLCAAIAKATEATND